MTQAKQTGMPQLELRPRQMIRRVLVQQPFKVMTYRYGGHSGTQMLLLISVLLRICLPDTESLVKEVQRATYRHFFLRK